MLKVLFVGLGSVGQRHLRNLWRLTNGQVDVSAVRQTRSVPVLTQDMQVDPKGNLAATYGIEEFDDLGTALASGPDAVFVTNPNRLHVPTALAAARAGAHLFIEKPLSASHDGLDELLDVVAVQRLQVMVGFQLRHHSGLKFVKSLLEDGRIGRVVAASFVNGEYLPNWHEYEDYRQGYAARCDLGGGALVTQIHDFDLALWFLGRPDRVFAVGGHLSELEVDVEDAVTILMSHEREYGTVPVSIHLDFLQAPPERSINIVGDRGKISWNFHTGKVLHHKRGDETALVRDFSTLDRNRLFVDQMKQFLAVIEGTAEPTVGLRDGVASLEIALAARRSLETGEVVRLKSGDHLGGDNNDGT